MRVITREEWERRERHGYTLVREDGTRCALFLTGAGTTLIPVEIEDKP